MERGARHGKTNKLVYSSQHGRICSGCGHPADRCMCSRATAPTTQGPVRVGRQTKGRKGKGVTVITGLALDARALAELGQKLRKRCGCGGTVKDGVIEMQGEHRDTLVEELRKLGFEAKRSG